MTTTTDALMSSEELAALLNVSVPTLYKWRHYGTGPKSLRVGKYLRYRRADVERWLETCGE